MRGNVWAQLSLGYTAFIILILMVLHTTPAVAHQPYGGCDEAWQAPQSAGAEHCRDHGFTVTHRFVLNPNLFVVALPPMKRCKNDEPPTTGWCYWNAKTMGNHKGTSYIARAKPYTFWRVRFYRTDQ